MPNGRQHAEVPTTGVTELYDVYAVDVLREVLCTLVHDDEDIVPQLG